MVDFVLNTPKCGLFLQMGLGKSRITLAAIACLNPPCHVLIVAPKNIARGSWIEEIKKIGLNIRYKSFIIDENGKNITKDEREKLFEEARTAPPTLYFINRELIKKMVDYYKTSWCFPFIVVDELQSFKSYGSQRFKALKFLCQNNLIVRFIGLTGTPAPNSLQDLWSEIYLMDNGLRLGRNITAYRNTWFRPGRTMNNYPIEWIPIPGAEESIYNRISDIVVSLSNAYVTLPDITYHNMYAYMSEEEQKLYKKMMKDMVLKIEGLDEEITADNAAVLQIKLSQIASGNLYINSQHDFIEIHKAKLEVLHYIVDNEPSPLLIAYYFKTDLNAILKEFPDAKAFDGSPEMLSEWNRGNIRMLLIQPASAGFGLNFQEGGHTLVWYTPTWNLEHYLQTNARLYRQGQTSNVMIHHILTKGTVDERIVKVLQKKDASQNELLDAVKYYIREVETSDGAA